MKRLLLILSALLLLAALLVSCGKKTGGATPSAPITVFTAEQTDAESPPSGDEENGTSEQAQPDGNAELPGEQNSDEEQTDAEPPPSEEEENGPPDQAQPGGDAELPGEENGTDDPYTKNY